MTLLLIAIALWLLLLAPLMMSSKLSAEERQKHNG